MKEPTSGHATSAAALIGPFHEARRSRLSRAGLRLADHKLILWLGDLVIALVSVVAALWGWSLRSGDEFSVALISQQMLWFVAVVPWMLLLLPSYNVVVVFSAKDTAKIVVKAAVLGLALYPLVYFLDPRELPRVVAVFFVGTACALTLIWHLMYISTFTRPENRSRVAIVGTGAAAQLILTVLRRVARHMSVVAFVHENGNGSSDAIDKVPVVTGPEGLHRVVTEQSVSEVVLAAESPIPPRMLRELVKCQEAGAEIVSMSTTYERLLQKIPINHLESDWVFTSLVDAIRFQEASRVAKRTVDVLGGLVGTVVFLLVLPLLGPIIWASAGRPILYRQLRVGRNNEVFELIKFRTMVDDAERNGPQWTGVHDGRVTPFGRFLRRSRLDEIPQFLNVLKGDMSLVGPRPERPEFVTELEQSIPFYRTRLLVRPGLTGWAQVNYRYGDSVNDAAVKLEYDLYYIKHQSLLFDLLIALRTIKTIVTFSGR